MIDLRNVTDPDEIVEILAAAAEAYENDGDSELTDAEYDALELQLRKLDPSNPFLTTVGSDVRGGKIPLPFKMGSLDQVYEGEIEKWVCDNSWDNETFIVTNKEDGISGLLVYDRDLKIAYSRGNGILGADITRHVSRTGQVPKRLKGKATIRVEVIMEDEVFETLKQKAIDNGERVYKTARNYVAGRMNASESPQEFYDNVRIIATSVVEPEMSKFDQIQFLIANGFDVPEYSVVDGLTLTDEYLTADLNERREQSKTAIDGLVIDLDDVALRTSLTRKSSSINPMYAKKFKVGEASNQANARVVQVHYEPSKTGYLKPRIEIEPVELTGVTIRFASGFNAAFIRDNGIGPGAIVDITRSGDVIPFVRNVLTPVTPQLPDETFGAWKWNDTNVDAVLLDPDNNDAVQLNKLIDMFTALEVVGLREGSLIKLYEAGYTTPEQIIKATRDELQDIIGEANGVKVFDSLKHRLNPVKLGILAGSSQILGRGIGRRKMTKLVKALGEDAILYHKLAVNDIVNVESFDTKTAQVVVDRLPLFKEFLNRIGGFYTLDIHQEIQGGTMSDIKVCFTGVRDKELEKVLESKGATVQSSVNKETTHLVAKDPNASSGKLDKARAAGVTIISLDEAQSLWN